MTLTKTKIPTTVPSVSLPTPKPMHKTWEDVSRVFPNLGETINTVQPRRLARESLRAAVSVECHRHFGQLDVADHVVRDNSIRYLREQIVRELKMEPNSIEVEDAVEMSSSSEDMYGRGLEESKALAVYALRSEWDLARSMGLATDELGTAYEMPFSEFCAAVNPSFSQEVRDAFGHEAAQYAEIVRRVNGRDAASSVPLADDLVPFTENFADGDQFEMPGESESAAREQEARESKRAQRKERLRNLGMFVGQLAEEYVAETREEDRRREAAQRDKEKRARDAKWDHMRDEQTKFYERANRKARKEGGRWW